MAQITGVTIKDFIDTDNKMVFTGFKENNLLVGLNGAGKFYFPV